MRKTSVIICLIEGPNGIKFKKIYLYLKSLHQPKYIQKNFNHQLTGWASTFAENTNVIQPNEAEEYSIMISDDVACVKQNNIRAYFCILFMSNLYPDS